MMNLKSEAFVEAVEREFSFLLDHGFAIPPDGRTDTPLTARVLYKGTHAAVELGLDRRDECVDCYVGAVINGVVKPFDQAHGYWGHLHEFLVRHRGYRGSFARFDRGNDGEPVHVRALRTYALALKTLAEDIVSDSPGVFTTKRKTD